jgi:Cu-Zn family superoxide dismutase
MQLRLTSVSGATVAGLAAVGALGLAVLSGQGALQRPAIAAAPVATTVLHTAAGVEVGSAVFTVDGEHVTLTITANDLAPGFHGLHVHSVGLCEGPDFASAGPHFNPPDMMQGTPQTGHAGDLPSLLVNQDGSAELSVVTDRFSAKDLLSDAGTALIVHAAPDNFANIPTRYAPAPDATTLATGDAGGRVACGVIQASASPLASAVSR